MFLIGMTIPCCQMVEFVAYSDERRFLVASLLTNMKPCILKTHETSVMI